MRRHVHERGDEIHRHGLARDFMNRDHVLQRPTQRRRPSLVLGRIPLDEDARRRGARDARKLSKRPHILRVLAHVPPPPIVLHAPNRARHVPRRRRSFPLAFDPRRRRAQQRSRRRVESRASGIVKRPRQRPQTHRPRRAFERVAQLRRQRLPSFAFERVASVRRVDASQRRERRRRAHRARLQRRAVQRVHRARGRERLEASVAIDRARASSAFALPREEFVQV